MIKVIYNKVCGRCVQSEPLTSGMVGQPIELEYSPDFDGLTLTAVFTNGKTTVDVLNPGNQCVIPHEVLDTVGTLVKVGIYATKGNELVIPTVYAAIGIVLKGADPSGDVSADPTLPVRAQIQALMGNLSDLNTETKNNLVAAINEAAQTGSGSASIAMRVDGGYIQYSTDNGKTWVNLIAEADLKGDKGDKGDKGADGAPGEKGDTGATGPQGPQGSIGPQGPQGNPGSPGKDGTSITISDISESAADGGTNTVTFSDGSALKVKNGLKGSAGSPGKDGVNGITPHIGENGNWYIGNTDTGKPSRGATGAKGDKGATGPQGETGATGPKGETGEQGPQGAKGDKGDPGAAFTYDMFTAAQLAALKGEKGNPGTPGKNGTDGQSAYAAAQAGGYTDTQANFYADLAAIQGLASALAAI